MAINGTHLLQNYGFFSLPPRLRGVNVRIMLLLLVAMFISPSPLSLSFPLRSVLDDDDVLIPALFVWCC